MTIFRIFSKLISFNADKMPRNNWKRWKHLPILIHSISFFIILTHYRQWCHMPSPKFSWFFGINWFAIIHTQTVFRSLMVHLINSENSHIDSTFIHILKLICKKLYSTKEIVYSLWLYHKVMNKSQQKSLNISKLSLRISFIM